MRLIKNIIFFSTFFQLIICNANATSYSDLSPADQTKVRNSKLVTIPVHLENNLLKGEIFKYLPSMTPVMLASVFFDYNQQYLFLPGMTSTHVLEWSGTRAWVRHRLNPMAFISKAPPKLFQNWFFDLGAYSYDLNEDVQYKDGTYTISWSMPQEARVLGSEEKGLIRFEPFDIGTLITYQNATEPFMYETLFNSPHPDVMIRKIQKFLCRTAQSYYERTVSLFVKRTQEVIDQGEIRDKIQHLMAVLNGDKAQ